MDRAGEQGMSLVCVRPLGRAETRALIGDIARLRIEVFRAWPYLYDGDDDYERGYLDTYLRAVGAVVVGAFDGAALVGAATASPLAEHFEDFADPFAAHGLDPSDWFYFGESVLLAPYRGTGIGVRFFEERERAARAQGYRRCVFSAVIRPGDHPLRPRDYRPLDAFWTKRGYARIDGLSTGFSWRDLGGAGETVKPMEYWAKTLA
jgi:GNAT superfamily N-acetyltransferase